VTARAYRPDRGLDFGKVDFLQVIANVRGGLLMRNVQNPMPSANERVTLIELLSNVFRARGAKVDAESFINERFPALERAKLAQPFSLITRADRARLLSIYAADNAAINARFQTLIPFVSEADIAMSDVDESRAQEHRAALASVLGAMNVVARMKRSTTAIQSIRLEETIPARKTPARREALAPSEGFVQGSTPV
jgi:hypothetical protein